MGKLIHKCKGINIFLNDTFHQHSKISLDLLLMLLDDNSIKIESCCKQGIDCIISEDCKFNVGVSHCIKCDPGTPHIYFKQRGNRPYLSRMIKGALPIDTTFVTIVLKPSGRYSMTLITAWAGRASVPELGNIQYFEHCVNPIEEIRKSADFWMHHALIEETPTEDELYDDITIIAKRINKTLDTLTSGELLNFIEARIGIVLPTEIIPCESTEKEELLSWLRSDIVPLYKQD